MIMYYFKNPEEALKRAKAAGKQPGCWWTGITLPSGKRGWAIYKDGKVLEQYAVTTINLQDPLQPDNSAGRFN